MEKFKLKKGAATRKILGTPGLVCNFFYSKNFFSFDLWNLFFIFSGVCHGDDLSYVFPLWLMGLHPDKNSPEEEMIYQMTKRFTNFAKTRRVTYIINI